MSYSSVINGNQPSSLFQAWKSRSPTLTYVAALVAVFLLTTHIISDLSNGKLFGVLYFSRQRGGTLEDFVFACALLGVLLNIAFAYTNYVTTARASFFLGRHGGLFDVAVVNCSVPCVVWWCRLYERGRLLPAVAGLSTNSLESRLDLLSLVHLHVAPYSAGVGLVAGLLIGLHILHLARGRFDGSISGADLAQVTQELCCVPLMRGAPETC